MFPSVIVVAFVTLMADAVALLVWSVPLVKFAAPPPASIAIRPNPAFTDFAAARVTPPVPLVSVMVPPLALMLSLMAMAPAPPPVSVSAPVPRLLIPPLPATTVMFLLALRVRLLAEV